MVAAATNLPPPPAQAPESITLYLELVINTQSSGQVVAVQMRDGHFYLPAEFLRELHVRTEAPNGALVAVDQINGVQMNYDSTGQRLELTLPPEWLPDQQIGSNSDRRLIWASDGEGFLLNYEIYASNPGGLANYTSLWSEQRQFGTWGVVSNTGVYRNSADGNDNGYMRYDTRWTHSDPDNVRTLVVGDLINGTLPWGNSVRLGGVQLARNFSVRPDLIPYPLPRFSGQTALPSAVDLFINGYKAGSEAVQPGPFTLNALPSINGAGEASIVTTDALGRRVLATVPFYVANTLLKAGTSDYALALGAIRKDYGIQNFSYGEAASTGAYRYGFTDTLTLEGRAEVSDSLRLAGAGLSTSLAGLGVVNIAVTQSEGLNTQGQQWNAGYQYNAQKFGFSLQHTLRSDGFNDLGSIGPLGNGLALQSTQLNVSRSLGDWGAVSVAYFDVFSHSGQRTQLASLNYSKAINNWNFLSLNFNSLVNTGDYNLQLQWTVLLDTMGAMSLLASRDQQGQSQQVQYSRSPAPSGGVGLNLSYAGRDKQEDFRQASATWRARNAQLQAGVYAQGNQSSTWAGISGSVVVMDGGIFVTNRINDAFALISTSGVEDVQLRFENQLIGRTDKDGHLLVTGVTANYPARFEIDTLELPDFMVALRTEQRIVIPAGSGTLLRFEINPILAARLTLVDLRGQPLPIGMQVLHVGSGKRTVVGWDGQVYLEGLGRDNELEVQGDNVPICRVRFTIDDLEPKVLQLGALICRPQSTFASTEADLAPQILAQGNLDAVPPHAPVPAAL